MRKVIALFLVFSLLALSGNLYAKERRGAELVVQKTDGQHVSGELIAVKENSLLLLSISGADVSVDIEDIKIIKIIKKSKALKSAGTGFLIGTGVLLALAIVVNEIFFGTEYRTKGMAKIGLLGAVPGALIGASSGKDSTFQIEGKSDSEIKKALDKLRKKARVPDYQ